MRSEIRLGVRIKRRKSDGRFIGNSAVVYDIASGNILPAYKAEIVIEPENLVYAVIKVELADMEVTDEV